MRGLIVLLILTFQQVTFTRAQLLESEKSPTTSDRFFADAVMGPYLFIEHIPYNSVLLQGARLGYESQNGIAFILEYVAGQQDDDQNTLGLTHNVSLQASYFMLPSTTKFRPYVFAGGGFLEFKSFTRDKYGMGYYAGLGTETNLSSRFKGLIEFRYLNIANFDYDAKNEVGVFWGVRANF